MDIQYFLDKANKAFDPTIFEHGQCHTFALALKMLFGGQLFAIMRHDAESDVEWYSHMVVEVNDDSFDINGHDAEESWCARFSEEDDFDFNLVELEHLNDFLQRWKCSIDYSLLDKLLNL